MDGISHRMIDTNGIKMHIAEQGSGPLVLLMHGFPELWYSWRHQIGALAEAGYHVVAPDLRGYGETDAPSSHTQYTYLHVVGDLIGLLDALDAPKEPGKVEAEFSFYGCPTFMRKFLAGNVPSLFAAPLDKGVLDVLEIPNPFPSWITEEEIDYYVKAFEKTGYTGGLNYYRALDLSWELAAPWTGAKLSVPTKYIVGSEDSVYKTPGMKDYIHGGGFNKYVPLLQELVVIEGAHHFIQQERSKEVTEHLLEFFGTFLTK